jgi:hypothetical protein
MNDHLSMINEQNDHIGKLNAKIVKHELENENFKFARCWGLVLKCYELRTRQHKMLMVKVPSSFEASFPLGYNDLQTKVMKNIPSSS